MSRTTSPSGAPPGAVTMSSRSAGRASGESRRAVRSSMSAARTDSLSAITKVWAPRRLSDSLRRVIRSRRGTPQRRYWPISPVRMATPSADVVSTPPLRLRVSSQLALTATSGRPTPSESRTKPMSMAFVAVSSSPGQAACMTSRRLGSSSVSAFVPARARARAAAPTARSRVEGGTRASTMVGVWASAR